MNLASFHRIAHYLYRKGVPVLPKIIYFIQFLLFNSSVPASTRIGKGSKFAYLGIGVVIHARSIIGENCMIGQGITIGGRSKSIEVPIIGDNCYLGAGSRILGGIKIGSNSIVGPNAVVLTDVPANCIVVGIPAKIIKEGINPTDFI